MKYRRCGKSGLLFPAVSLGLWHNFENVDNFATARKILLEAFDSGITHFDLANNYGPPPGSAEQNFGKVLTNDLSAHRDEIIVSTKAGHEMWDGPYGGNGSRKHLLASLDQSLKRMNLEYVDIFYSHRPDPHVPLEETMMALDAAVRQGKALYVGISKYDVDQTLQALEILHELKTPVIIHQERYSMLERRRMEELTSVLADRGIGAIGFSPLAQGLLTDRYLKGIEKGSRANKPHGFLKKERITPELISKINQLNLLAKERNQTLAQMALSWNLRVSQICSVIVGASSVAQLQNSLKCIDNLNFSAKELMIIDEILSS